MLKEAYQISKIHATVSGTGSLWITRSSGSSPPSFLEALGDTSSPACAGGYRNVLKEAYQISKTHVNISGTWFSVDYEEQW